MQDTLVLDAPIAIATNHPLIYELSKRGSSSWVKKGTEKDKNPQHLNCAKSILLEVRTKWNAGPGQGEIEIQYVPGAPTIFVNNYVDANGEKQKGLRELGYDLKGEDLRRAVEENIKFVNGFLYLETYGGLDNKTLLDFIEHHSSNEGSPNFKVKRNMNTMFLFKPLVKEKQAANQLENLEIENEAHNLFTNLRTKAGKGFEYDTAKIDAILGILEIGNGLQSNESSQKMLLIAPYIKNSVKFMKVYNEAIENYKTTIKLAVTTKVIVFGKGEVKIHITNVTPVITFELAKTTKDEQTEELVFHFLGTESGRITYSQLIGEVENKKLEALGSK